MGKYERGDDATYHFVLKKYQGEKIIQAWSDNKDLVKLYMQFHNCKSFSYKSIRDKIENIAKICNENIHDEIQLYSITTRDPKKPNEVKSIWIPATETEIMLVNEESNNYLSSFIDYSSINKVLPYLKDKYKRALSDLHLTDVINFLIYSKTSYFIQSVKIDQLMVFYRCFEENFG